MNKTPQPTDVYVGNRVRMRRLSLDIAQTSLGNALGVTFQQIQKYEKGTNRIGSSRLQQIANFLQVPVSYFFEGLESSVDTTIPSASSMSEYLSSREGLRLAKAFLRVKNARLRRSIVALVEAAAIRNAIDRSEDAAVGSEMS